MNATTKRQVIEQANAALAQWPQYRGHFDGPEWVLVTFRKAVKTKMGTAFLKGDVTIAKADRNGDSRYVSAWSFRNGIETSVPITAIRAD